MNIYFCGSIRGGRQDAALYASMIRYLSQYGRVLTEHVGDSSLTDLGGDGTNEYIYQRDTAWLRESDILIAECTTPSLGVGYELAYGEAQGKPVHIFYGGEDPRRLSAMLSGDPGFQKHFYRTEAELHSEIDGIFRK